MYHRVIDLFKNVKPDEKEKLIELLNTYGAGLFDKVCDELKYDPAILMVAIKYDYKYFSNFDNEHINNKDFVIRCLKINSKIFKILNVDMRSDFDVALIAVLSSSNNIKFVNESLKGNKSFMKKCIKKHNCCYNYIEKNLKADKELALMALSKNKKYYYDLDETLKNDEDILGIFAKKQLAVEDFEICDNSDPILFKKYIDECNKNYYTDILNKLKKHFYKSYYEKVAKDDPKLDNERDFIYSIINSKQLEKIISSNLYNRSDIDVIISILRSFDTDFYNKTISRIKLIEKKYQAINLNMFNEIVINKENTSMLSIILDKYKFDSKNFFELIKNNKFILKTQKGALLEIMSNYFKKDIISDYNLLILFEESFNRNMPIRLLLKEKDLEFNNLLEKYDVYLKENVNLINKIKGDNSLFKYARTAYKVIDSFYLNMDDFNSKINVSFKDLLNSLNETEIYSLLVEKYDLLNKNKVLKK